MGICFFARRRFERSVATVLVGNLLLTAIEFIFCAPKYQFQQQAVAKKIRNAIITQNTGGALHGFSAIELF
jgi:hypothetical protein